MAIAFMCGIAAVTIPVAIVAKKLSDPQAWIAVVFFTAIGAASWIAGRAASI
jgi:fucose permease